MTVQQIIDRATVLQNSTQLKEFDNFCINAIKSLAQNSFSYQNYTEIFLNSTQLLDMIENGRTLLTARSAFSCFQYYIELHTSEDLSNTLTLDTPYYYLNQYDSSCIQSSIFMDINPTINQFISGSAQFSNVIEGVAEQSKFGLGEPLRFQPWNTVTITGTTAKTAKFKIWYNVIDLDV